MTKLTKQSILGRKAVRGIAVAAIVGTAMFLGASSRVEWLATPDHAYILLPAALVTDGSVVRSTWAPNGAYLMVASIPSIGPTLDQILNYSPSKGGDLSVLPKAGPALLVWDRVKQQVRKLWSTDDPSVEVIDIEWLKNSSTAYITMMGETTENGKTDTFCGVMAMDADSGKFSWVPGMEHLPQIPTIATSPLQPTAVIAFNDVPLPPRPAFVQGNAVIAAGPPVTIGVAGDAPKQPSTFPAGEFLAEGTDVFCVVGPGGKVSRRVQTGPIAVGGIVWGKDGAKWYLGTRERKSKAVSAQQLEDNGKLTPVTVDLYAPPAERSPEVIVSTKPMTAKLRKVRRGFNNVWLSSPKQTFHPDVLVTPNGGQPELSPTQDAVFYVESGIAKVRELVALNDEQKKGLYEALKQQAISDAKQVGLGLLMYSSDYDDMLPSADAFDGIDPYLRNREMMDGFNYMPPGDLSTTRMQNPASTPLGTIDGPGGQATVWGDGHVTWGPSP